MRIFSHLFFALALLLPACSGSGTGTVFPGYMEAELVLVGAEASGRVVQLSVEEGGTVKAGDPLFALEGSPQKANAAAAQERLNEAEAALNLSRLSLERAKNLRERGVVPQSRLDDAQSAYDRNLAAAAAARAAHEEAASMLDQRTVTAPANGAIEEIYFRPGEVVNAGQPVVAILPPGNLKVRFYVPAPLRAALRKGQTVNVSCDGCPSELTASISFIAREAEYTPPIIFSREERSKLVYLIEARPNGETAKLTAGQPVTIHLEARPEALGS